MLPAGTDAGASGDPGGSPDDLGLDEIMQGFDSAPAPDHEATGFAAGQPAMGKGDVSLELTFVSSYSFSHDTPPPGETDFRGLSQLAVQLDLGIRRKLSEDWRMVLGARAYRDFNYQIQGRDGYSSDTLDEMETDLKIEEAYVEGPLVGGLFLKAGRQIEVWGKADTIRVTDVLNPMDLRTPGLQDIDQLRLPVAMTRLDLPGDPLSVGIVLVNERRFNREPPPGSEFYPYDPRLPLLPEDKPAQKYGLFDVGLSFDLRLSGADLSMYLGRFYDNMASLGWNDPARPLTVTPLVERKHDMLSMVGLAGDVTHGNWLFKWEAAYLDGFEFLATPDQELARVDVLLGLDYLGFPDTVLSLESVARHFPDYQDALDNPADQVNQTEYQTVLRMQRDFLRDRLHTVAYASLFRADGDDGGFLRTTAQYDLSDRLSIMGGVVFYYSGGYPLAEKVKDNDRVFFQVSYDVF